jgi:integrase/recombinase XerC
MPANFRVDRTHKLPADAEIVEKDGRPHVRIRDGGRAALYKLTRDGSGYLRPSKSWYPDVKDADGKLKRVRLSPSKVAAQVMLTKLLLEVEEGRAGIRTKRTGAGKLPLTDLLAEYERHQLDRGTTAKQSTQSAYRCRTALDGCAMLTLADLDHAPVERWLADRRGRAKRDGGIAAQTSNHFVVAMKAFGNFLVRTDRVTANPFRHLAKVRIEAGIKHTRRALTDAEFNRLVDAARAGSPLRGLTGEDRAALYLVAGMTGLRAAELASLSRGSFDLASTTPVVVVEAAYSNHRRKDVVPLHAALVTHLRPYLAGKPAGSPVWPGNWAKYTEAVEFIRRDLTAARAAWFAEATDPVDGAGREASDFLKYEESKGGKADFHALRHRFVTELANSDAPPKVVQELARYASITTTMNNCAHVSLEGTAKAVAKLADPMAGVLGAANGAATSRSGCGPLTTDGETKGVKPPPAGIPQVLDLSAKDDDCGRETTADDGEVESTPNRSRTYNLRFRRPNAADKYPSNPSTSSDYLPSGVPPGVPPSPIPNDLAAVVTAWPTLPDALKAAVLAIVGSQTEDAERTTSAGKANQAYPATTPGRPPEPDELN